MTGSTQERVEQLEEMVQQLTEQARLGALVDRFVSGLDHVDPAWADEAWYRSLFTEDIVLDMPNGVHQGIAGVPEFFGVPKKQWARTHHMTSNHIVEVTGGTATGRANVQATHVPHGPDSPLFTGGARYEFEAVRTPHGWRISRLTTAVTWIDDRTRTAADAAR
ncbi:nuclear transport factor 2 family protein [Streptomyces sp. NPDC019224]|uniref:nuclear transport factor 2 family protein n=1 Tax=Streptomyces sp. NPDC019224 TaxID=3154484 RepID=UPI0033DCAFF2